MKFREMVDKAYRITVRAGERGVTVYQLAYYFDISVSKAYQIIRTLLDIYPCDREGSRVTCKEGVEVEQ